jgi:glycosyltransferase involved in cell wall biosynthesis
MTASRETLGHTKGIEAARVACLACWNPRAALAMHRIIAEFRPDVVHLHKLYPQLSVAPARIAAKSGVPVVQTLHDYEFMSADALNDRGGVIDTGTPGFTAGALNSVLFRVRRTIHAPTVTVWVSISRYVAERAAEAGIDSTIVRNFTAAAASANPPLPLNARSGVAFVGRLAREKGVSDVLALARALPSVKVRIAGAGPMEDVVRRAAERSANIEWLGTLDRTRVLDLLRFAAVVVIPSRWAEPAGLVALEAMTAGTPVVAYNRGGLSEYVRVSGAGDVVAPSHDSLIAACRHLLEDPQRWQGMSSRGIRATQTILSATSSMSDLERVYVRAISQYPRTGWRPFWAGE